MPADIHDALSAPLARAVSRRTDGALLSRWLAAPQNWNVNSPKAPTKGFTENGSPPQGVAFVNRGSKKNKAWHRWDGQAWVPCGPPGSEEIPTKKTGTPSATTVAQQGPSPIPDTPPKKIEPQQPAEELKPLPPPFKLEEHVNELPDMALASAFEALPLDQVRQMRLVSTRYERVASFVLRRRMQKLIKKTALSSLGGTLCDDLAGHLARLNPDDLFVLSDQVSPAVIEKLTANSFYDTMYQPPQEQRQGRGGRPFWVTPRPYRVKGYNAGKRTLVYAGEHGQIPVGAQHGQLKYEQELHGPDPGATSKMHVKSMIGSKAGKPTFIETGSANLTTSAMQNNTESVVLLESPGIAKMFKQYAGEVVKGHKQADSPEFSSALAGFNKRNPIGIRAALAPFVNVGEQLTAELKGADTVLVRMFLVSDAKQGIANQPLEALCKLARDGVRVTVVVDTGQADTGYVKQALRKLENAGATVALETGPGGGGIMHDKLVFAHYRGAPRATEMDLPTPERWTVMVGSSGLTKNVIQNENYENLLIIDDDVLYSDLLKHDDAASFNMTYETKREENV